MSGLDDLRITFFQECEDLLEQLGEGLRVLEASEAAPDIETVHAVFRAVHSIKGGAGAFALNDLVTFAHLFETVLDHLRSGRMAASAPLMATLLRSGDFLADLVANARDGVAPDAGRMRALLAELDALADAEGGPGHDGEDTEPFDFVPMGLDLDLGPMPDAAAEAGDATAESESGSAGGYLIRFRPHAAMYGTGNEPAALLRALARLGTVQVTADLSAVRPLTRFDPGETQLAWQLRLDTDASRSEVEAVFEFVEDVVSLDITSLPRGEGSPAAGPTDQPPAPDLGPPAPVSMGDAPADLPATAQQRPPATVRPLPSPPDATDSAVPAEPAPRVPASVDTSPDAGAGVAAPTAATAGNVTPLAAPATIRVNLDRVDRLINLIGELVIMEAMLSQVIGEAGISADSDVANGLDGIKQLASEIQESVMAIRAQPLKPVFQRMHRIVREASEATGKGARLVTLGENTEVDKTVIERLVDPLTHMIRNAVDHGLEDAESRRAAGKPAEGTITLSAAHRSGRVVIEVADDGGGIDRPRVKSIAERKGLIPAGAQLSPTEIDNLLFMPGFSSKAEVSALSGRGVGLDVVRREIAALGGRVAIESVPGRGTTFTIALPLTLAVLEGMLVSFGGETMVLPISAIVETLHAGTATIHPIGLTGRVLANRSELIPIIDLATAFGLARERKKSQPGVLIVVECEAGRRAALEVDHIHDQRQVVIKSLEENYGSVPGISAATILGDGRIALIVDPEEIVSTAAPDPLSPLLAETV